MIPIMERLAANSEWQGECLVWTGHVNEKGYGRITVGDRHVYIHRAAWVARHGPIPPETPHVLHRCDNPPCFRDEHLWLGTHADNMADCAAKGRGSTHERDKTHCKRGHPFSGDNLRYAPNGQRRCRECVRMYGRKYAAQRAAASRYAEVGR